MYDYYERMYELIADYEREYQENPRKVIRKIMQENLLAMFRGAKQQSREFGTVDYEKLSRKISNEVVSKIQQSNDAVYMKEMRNGLDSVELFFDDAKIRQKIEKQVACKGTEEEQSIPAIFITDNKYAFPTAVAISSLMFNAKDPSSFDVYVIGDCLDDDMKNLIVSSGIHVTVVEADKDFSEVNFEHAHVTKAALNKFFIPELFPDLNKALYLDSDMLFLGDLKELFDQELGSNLIAAVPDYHIITSNYMRIINQEGCTNYFNSGMLLMDLAGMRKGGYSERLLQKKIKLSANIKFSFMDQDALNLVFYGRIKYLPIKYNFLNVYYSEKSEYEMHEVSGMPMADVIEAYEKPHVLHIGGGNKPWNSLLGERLTLYRYYKTVNRLYREINEKNR